MQQDDQTIQIMLKTWFKLRQRFSQIAKVNSEKKTQKTPRDVMINLFCKAAVLSHLPGDWEVFSHPIISPVCEVMVSVVPYGQCLSLAVSGR